MLRSPAFGGVVSRGAGMTGAFGLSVAILRSMSTSAAGLVLLVYTLITIAATLARFGSDNLALREVSKTPEASGSLIRHAFTIAVVLTPAAALLLIGAVLLRGREPDSAQVAMAAAAAVLPASLSVIAGAVLRGLSKVAAGTLAELGSPLLLSAGGIAILGLTQNASAVTAVWMITAGYAVTAIWSWTLIFRLVPDIRHRTREFGAFCRRFRASLAAFFTTSMGFYLFSWMPALAFGYFIKDHTTAQSNVALFNAGSKISQLVILVPTIQISYLSQQFASLNHRNDLAALNRTSQGATRIAMMWAIPLTAAMLWMPRTALSIFGDYAGAAASLQVLAIGALLVAVLGPVNGLMLTCGHERAAGRYSLVLLAASSVALPILTRWGSLGVSVGSSTIALTYAAACYVTLSRNGIHAAIPPRRRGR
jgi:O-antigen/teichoic acid export membrane protein